jgi:hypothetical protein
METLSVDIDRGKALELYREYRKHAHWSAPIDRECQRAYQLISQGRMVIQALESVKLAGLYTEGEGAGFPKLALCRADALSCSAYISMDGSCEMTADNARMRYSRRGSPWSPINSRSAIAWPADTFPAPVNRRRWRASAMVPLPPLHLRPKRGLENYHTLFEAEWSRTPPSDPLLLRQIGKADMWLVVAHWDLTPVEKAALATRVRA